MGAEYLASSRIRSRAIQLVVSRCNDYTILTHSSCVSFIDKTQFLLRGIKTNTTSPLWMPAVKLPSSYEE
jgi:hypothetical protein